LTASSGALPLTFHPQNISQHVALHLARRFDDLRRLPQYLNIFEPHPLPDLISAARDAHAAAEAGAERAGELFLRRFGERTAL
jgi:hypothetical protein